MVVQHVRQQSLAASLGETQAMQACLPTCLFMLARAYGYLSAETTLAAFCDGLDWAHHDIDGSWKRASLTADIRAQYGLQVVSWWLTGVYDRDRMTASGYVTSDDEWEFFDQVVKGNDVFELLQAGYPVIVTVHPDFSHNGDVHAIILNGYHDGSIVVIDPDARNERSLYSEAEIRDGLSAIGAATIVLPRKIG